jgi:arylsulfatase A-like enzyme
MNVVVVIARGLQAGALGPYGNPWIDTPALDALAAEGVVFDWHFADAADAAGARRAWRMGRYHLPSVGQVGNLPHGEEPDLLTHLRQKGVHTHLILDGSRPMPSGFEEGWDRVEVVPAEDGEETPLERTIAAAQSALKRLRKRDGWLVWVDLATPLPPWDVPAEFQEPYFQEEEIDEEAVEGKEENPELEQHESESLTPLIDPPTGSMDPNDDVLFLRMQNSYAAAVSYVDAGIGEVVESLRTMKLWDRTAFLVTSDRGQALGEHGVVGEVRPWPHEEIIHLPLIVRMPGTAEAVRRVAALTQAVDLAPTLAELLGAPLEGAHGHSLLPLLRAEVEELRPYVCAGLAVGGEMEWALRTPEWAFLLSTSHPPRLFVKPDDRSEVNDVRQHHLELAEEMEQTLRAFVEVSQKPGPLTPPALREVQAKEPIQEGGTT